jgi:hypothetical protein
VIFLYGIANKFVFPYCEGIPYDYWSQYVGIFGAFAEVAGYAIGIGFVIAFLFLLVTFFVEKHVGSFLIGSFVGSFLIAVTTILSLVSVAGLSILAGVNLTGFSNMSMVLSVGFSVEYSVHVATRWLRADADLVGIDRVEHTMSFLFLPTFMSFVSSLIGVVCLAFTEFEFNEVYFFRPLILVMPITYFFGCWWLPVAVSIGAMCCCLNLVYLMFACLLMLQLAHLNIGFGEQETSGESDNSGNSEKREEQTA